MSSVLSRVPRPLDFDRSVFGQLVPIDLLAIVGFVAVGEISHGAQSLAVLSQMLVTTSTFVIGWLLFAPILGAYGSRAADDLLGTIMGPLWAWPLAAAVVQPIRSTEIVPGNAALSFYLVSVAFGGFLLVSARYIATRYR